MATQPGGLTAISNESDRLEISSKTPAARKGMHYYSVFKDRPV